MKFFKRILIGLFLTFFACSAYVQTIDIGYGWNEFDGESGVKYVITRGRVPNINAHGYDVYQLLVQKGNNIYFVPFQDFRTKEGADCFVQDFVFQNDPFRVIKREREFGDSWADDGFVRVQTYGVRETFEGGYEMHLLSEKTLPAMCDVRDVEM